MDWFGICTSDDLCQTWDANYYKGIGNICLEMIVVDPVEPGKVLFAGADGQPCISRDSGRTYATLPLLDAKENYYCSTVICPSQFDPSLLVYGVTNSSERLSALCVSGDDGKNCRVTVSLKKGLFVQAIKEDPFHRGVFFAYIDGTINDGAGLYKSDDWGRSWKKMSIPLLDHLSTLPVRKDFIEGELLAVTAYQAKNICGTNQLLCIDPTKENTIYFGEADKGIFATFDGGNSWQILGSGLPFGKDTASILNAIKADPKRPGWLYAGFIHEGLWRSEDYGTSWQKYSRWTTRLSTQLPLLSADPRGTNFTWQANPSSGRSPICRLCKFRQWLIVDKYLRYGARRASVEGYRRRQQDRKPLRRNEWKFRISTARESSQNERFTQNNGMPKNTTHESFSWKA